MASSRSARALLGWLAIAVSCLCTVGTTRGSANDTQSSDNATLAAQIISLSGQNAGLCVHVGCGDSDLVLELVRQSSMLVQTLEPEPALVGETRRRFKSEYGRVTVIHWTLGELPYSTLHRLGWSPYLRKFHRPLNLRVQLREP